MKLADEQKFVKGPKWDELPQENTKVMMAAEHSPEPSKMNQHPDRKESEHEEPQRQKTFKPEIDI